MSLHYLDPEREPRECPRCKGKGEWSAGVTNYPCHPCHSTGRLGDSAATPDLLISHMKAGPIESGFYYTTKLRDSNLDFDLDWDGPFPTEAAAVAAARAAHREQNAEGRAVAEREEAK